MPLSIHLLHYTGETDAQKYRVTHLRSQQVVPKLETEPKGSDSWSFGLKQATGRQSSGVSPS